MFLMASCSSELCIKDVPLRCPNMAVRQAEENDGDDDLENIEPASVGVALLRGTSCGTVCDVLCCVVLFCFVLFWVALCVMM